MNKRYTISFLTNNVHSYYTNQILRGIVNRCRELDLNLLIFTGESLDLDFLNLKRNNIIFKLSDKRNSDGIILNSGALSNFSDDKRYNEFVQNYAGIPKVSISKTVKDIPSIIVDNKIGISKLINHLILDHNKSKIAYISGPEANFDAIERLNVFKDILIKNNIPVNHDLILYGDFTTSDYTKNKLIKLIEDKKNKKNDIDTIICANDEMALTAYEVVKSYNYCIPDDIIVTGFDNSRFSKFLTPALTTVMQPLNELGDKSVDMIYKILNGNKVKSITKFPTKLVIRESCGCSYFIKKNIFINNRNKYIKNIGDLVNYEAEIIKKVNNEIIGKRKIYIRSKNEYKTKIKSLINTTINDIIKDESNFQYQIRGFFELFSENLSVIEIIMSIIDIIYKFILDIISSKDHYEIIIHKFHNFYILFIKEIEQFNNKIIEDEFSQYLIYKLTEFDSSFDLNDFIELLKTIINRLKFGVFFLASYSRNNNKNNNIELFKYNELPTEYSKVIYSYIENNKNINIKLNTVFKTMNIFPENFKSQLDNQLFSLIVSPICFEDNHFGFLCYNLMYFDKQSYNLFFLFLKSTLKSISLFEEIKSTKYELEISNDKLKQLDKLKNDFIANITHDFRSPLTVILNMADLGIKSLNKEDDENKENYELIYNACLKLNKSIDKLLDLAKMESKGVNLRIENVKLVQFMKSILNFFSSSVTGENIKIKKELPDHEIDDFYTDKDKLEEIINNIISNAIKFVNPQHGEIKIFLEDNEKSVVIKISDNGIGIEKEKLEIIFNRFEQAKGGRNSIYQGTGIGLAFSKQLVDFLKGKIWADSDGIGKGATFYIELMKGKNIFNKKDFIRIEEMFNRKKTDYDLKKIIQSELNKRKVPEKISIEFEDLNRENEFDIKKSKILLVDDDQNILKIIKKYLKLNGFKNFLIAHDGKMGLEAVYSHLPDIIICDYNMPNMRGNEFHEELINNPNFEQIPFIFLSAISDSKIISKQRKKGAKAYLTKPINEDELVITVTQNLKMYFDFLQMYHLAAVDALTKIYNRREITKILKHEIFKRKLPNISIILFDIDLFKQYNDSYGHQFGDKILKEIGALLNNCLRKYDYAGRYGGDEFIVILTDVNISEAKHVAEILRTKIANLNLRYKNKSIKVTASFGAASLIDNMDYVCKQVSINDLTSIYNIKKPEKVNWENIESIKGKILDVLIEISDIALYHAKSYICNSCGHIFIEKNTHCPKCNSTDINKGRNKVIGFKD